MKNKFIFRFLKEKLKRKKTISGEALPSRHINQKKRLQVAFMLTITIIILVNFLLSSILTMIQEVRKIEENLSLFSLFKINYSKVFLLRNFLNFKVTSDFYILYIFLFLFFLILIYTKYSYGKEEVIAYGQKGDSRFTTIEELKKQYKYIPNKAKKYPGLKSFKGIGGIPISHYQNKYFIDTDTVNSLILGASRSGKGETVITPMIDILSRAEIQSSMVVNDPKGELFTASKDTLEARGYDVQVLNILDPMQSMSYNPLQMVIDAWVAGNPEEAAKKANSIAFTLYNDPKAGENRFFHEGAQSAVVAIILTIVEYAIENNQVEKITMNNVVNMLNELGTWNWTNEKTGQEFNALDEWFKGLPSGHVAKKRYGATSFSGERTRGSILAMANTGLQPFVDDAFAKMTSRNSLDLKQIGFSKYIFGQLSDELVNKRIHVSFHRNNERKTKLADYKVKVKAKGRFSLNFDEFNGGVAKENNRIQDRDLLLVRYVDSMQREYKLIYELKFNKKENNIENKQLDTKMYYRRELDLKCLFNTFPEVKQHVRMKYSNQPTAVFMIVPDYDSTDHALASIFIKQLYTELSSNSVETKGNRTFRRVHYLLDEFGNMPPIDDMDQVMTVCLGRNMLFTLVVQSFQQLESKYGSESETIKDNSQNLVYILSTNIDTIEEVSKKAGNQTVVEISSNQEHGNPNHKITKSAVQQPLIQTARLLQFLEGEQLVIRALKRQDLKQNKVRPYPIFNTKETVMPYRWEFLSEWIDTSNQLDEIDISSEHINLSLEEMALDMSHFIRNKEQRIKYMAQNNALKKSTEEQFVSELEKEIEETKIIKERQRHASNLLENLKEQKFSFHIKNKIEEYLMEIVEKGDTELVLEEKIKKEIKNKNSIYYQRLAFFDLWKGEKIEDK